MKGWLTLVIIILFTRSISVVFAEQILTEALLHSKTALIMVYNDWDSAIGT